MRELSELEDDAVREIFNIGIGAAAESMSMMVDDEVMLAVPRLEFVTRADAAAHLAAATASTVCSVNQEFASTFGGGNAMLMFPEIQSLELARAMIGDESDIDEMTELEQEALTEIGNIVLNACLGSLSNILTDEIFVDLPSFRRGEVDRLLEELVAAEDVVMVLYIQFRLSQRAIDGRLVFIMNGTSLEGFVDRVVQGMLACA